MSQLVQEARTFEKRVNDIEISILPPKHPLRSSVLKVILPDKSSGTMFAVKYTRLKGQGKIKALVTNNHVVQAAEKSYLEQLKFEFAPTRGLLNEGGKKEISMRDFTFKSIWTDAGLDITLLEVTKQTMKKLGKYGIKYLTIAPVNLGEKIYCVGYPDGIGPCRSPGEIREIDINSGQIKHSASTYRGSSGSPIINYNSKVVGICWGYYQNQAYYRATCLNISFELFLKFQEKSKEEREDQNFMDQNSNYLEEGMHLLDPCRQLDLKVKQVLPDESKGASSGAALLKTDIEPPEITRDKFVSLKLKEQNKTYPALLHEMLTQQQIVQVVGEAGSGKTTLALHFAYAYANSGTVVRWVQADSNAAVHRGLKQILVDLKLSELYNQRAREDANPTRVLKKMVDAEIEKFQKPMLIVFDNVEHVIDIESFLQLPPKNAKFLITSRVRFYVTAKHFKIPDESILTLELFDVEAAKELVRRELSLLCLEDTLKMFLKNFEGVRQFSPLSLSLAIKQFNQGTNVSFEHLAHNFRFVLQSDSIEEEINQIVRKVIEEQSEFTMILIQCATYLDSEFVPLEAVEYRLQRQATEMEVTIALKCRLFTLVHRGDRWGFRVHRLVQASLMHIFIQNWHKVNPEFAHILDGTTVLKWVTGYLNNAFPLCDTYILDDFHPRFKRCQELVTQVVALDKHEPQSDEEFEQRAQLYYKYQSYLRVGENQIKQARTISDRALSWHTKLLLLTRAHLHYGLGTCALKLDAVIEARTELTLSSQLLKTLIMGDPKENKMRSMEDIGLIRELSQVEYQLARTFAKLCDYKEAIISFQDTIELREQVKENSFRYKFELAKCYRAKSEIHKRDRDWRPTKKCQEKAEELLRDLYNFISLNPENIRQKTAVLYEWIRLEPKPETSINCLNEKLAIEEKEYAANLNHPDLGWTLNELGIKYSSEEVHRWEEAENSFLRAIKIREENQSIERANTLHNLARVYLIGFERKRVNEAVPLLIKALAFDRKDDYQRIIKRIEDLVRAYDFLEKGDLADACRRERERLEKLIEEEEEMRDKFK